MPNAEEATGGSWPSSDECEAAALRGAAEFLRLTGAQLAFDRQIEQSQIPYLMRQLPPDADRPNLFLFQRSFLTSKVPFIPWHPVPRFNGMRVHEVFLQSMKGVLFSMVEGR